MTADDVVLVRCGSPSCDVHGGRVLYVLLAGGTAASYKHRGSGVVMIGGVPALTTCRCGWVWRNPAMAALLDQIDHLEDG